MPEWGSSGSVRGVRSNAHPYRDKHARGRSSSISIPSHRRRPLSISDMSPGLCVCEKLAEVGQSRAMLPRPACGESGLSAPAQHPQVGRELAPHPKGCAVSIPW